MSQTNNSSLKKAFITGVTGQDGSYLAELLLNKGYEVHGLLRRSSSFNTGRITHLYTDKNNFYNNRFILHYGDLTDMSSLCHIISDVKPDEIYNLAAQSHVKTSFELPEYTSDVAGMGFIRLLEAVRAAKLHDKIKIYQASTSEMFGDYPVHPQNEKTPLQPCSPYGCAKVYAHYVGKVYREGFKMFISAGILFNHESPRRGETFVTRKITRGVACIKLGLLQQISLGNLDSYRDWGHAKDYVEAMWLMLQHDKPDDFVIATGRSITVREFATKCFDFIGLKLTWKGHGIEESGVDQNGVMRVVVNKRYFRAKEVDYLQGDASKAREVLKWQPKITLEEMIKEMIESDIEKFKSNPYS